MNNLGQTLLHTNLTALIDLILFPFLLIFTLRRISHSCKQLIADRYGIHGQIIFGGIGIIIHEFSHLIIAIIFGHKITSFRLLHVPRGNDDNSLGYVNHTFNPQSSYQRMGNLFIGIAPIFGCAAALMFTTWLLEPQIITSFNTLPNLRFPVGIFTLESIWKLIGLIFIASSISIGGFDLSSADLSNIKFGLIVIVGITIFTSSFATVLGVAPAYLAWLHNVSTTFNGIMFFSLVVTLLSNGLIRIITNR
ncbi:hypothetical protein [Lactobacillus sp. Sy-1]|uniref:hypothetical protein n=1 Tax=Lactobacillus sp. Sy-1 TaxID=2109645 RepID=UPI001C59F300|nr:hypothetical protein [Lactobacillus sp. Sy-1]MBW1604906.1 hypothetical protein [Lactobacillus sp. Sy-1]